MDKVKKTNTLNDLWETSRLNGANADYLEALYEDYLSDPEAVDPQWRAYFDQLQAGQTQQDPIHSAIRNKFRDFSRTSSKAVATSCSLDIEQYQKQVSVQNLIHAYRFGGHQKADFDPLSQRNNIDVPSLALEKYGLSAQDLTTEFYTNDLYGPEKTSLSHIIEVLEKTYCGAVGSEYLHSTTMAEREWIQAHLEQHFSQPDYDIETKKRLLKRLTAAEGLERFLHTKYVGQKRFSLEGADSLIPMLDECIHRAGNQGAKEVIIGMAHRGRLNVLVNIMGKRPEDLFNEFEGKAEQIKDGTGDVKYHMGFSSNITTKGGDVHIALAFNPSHLEIVGPVVEGSVRARQERRSDAEGDQVIPILIHGDAAFAGQGVVMETLNMSQSRGYSTKGTVRIIINNQIGFTTSNQKDSRSTLYCTDVAKMVNAPIFHVNGDDPEAVYFVTRLAMDYRQKFHKDVVIDLVCYRRHGHSEADEPFTTQPMMYQAIKNKKTPRALYAARLLETQVIEEGYDRLLLENYRKMLDAGQPVIVDRMSDNKDRHPYQGAWQPFLEKHCDVIVKTAVDEDTVNQLRPHLTNVPDGFKLHFSVNKVFTARKKMLSGEQPLDWGCAETLAYATLINENFHVRLSGQDVGRGTFFHRHAVVHNQMNGKSYVPLRNLTTDKAKFLVINSLLSEEAVLAFEYGYATTDPNTLTIWEAQFGDFANGAQVVIDQFISAGEQKWNRLCGLVMFLPHGYEGQGPEHSSARLERYLQLCAENNIQVCVPTTPAQIFHLLRRQMRITCRKPLVVMTPKSLLRHHLAVSDLSEITHGKFQPIIPEIDEHEEQDVRRVIFCHGRVYYDLLTRRRENKRDDVVIIRMEQLYPFPVAQMRKEIQRYRNATTFVWCQEEPKNQGSWFTSQHHVRSILGHDAYLEYAGRPFSAAPAVGYPALHKQQLDQLLNDAIGEPDNKTKE
ncbi:MAG TPA: 2-oxoglutarate dehydrogenase E1 component [Gammaproteobacteria bacterium]|nr:2-oxoglutarate dehydrogenase E1 component [Gammaproteobacteria bacterium]